MSAQLTANMSYGFRTLPPRPPHFRFESTTALRQSVMSAEDEYSAYEDALLAEVNALRRDPAAYALVVESHATVGFPFVRDDPIPEHCSDMTLDQLRVCVQDLQCERAALEETLLRTRAECTDAEAALREKWGQEDAERSRRAKRGAPPRRQRINSNPSSSLMPQPPQHQQQQPKDSPNACGDSAVSSRQRAMAAAAVRAEFNRRIRETEARLRVVDMSCRWAADGARRIAALAAELRGASEGRAVAASRSLTLAARDVGNACHRVLSVSVPPPPPLRRPAAPAATAPNATAAAATAPNAPHAQSGSQLTPRAAQGAGRTNSAGNASSGGRTNSAGRLSSARRSATVRAAGRSPTSSTGSRSSAELDPETLAAAAPLEPEAPVPAVPAAAPLVPPVDTVVEGRRLAAAAAEMHKRYGYCAGEMRGVQLCGALPPRAVVIQMLLGLRAPNFAVPAPCAKAEAMRKAKKEEEEKEKEKEKEKEGDASTGREKPNANSVDIMNGLGEACVSTLLWEDARLFGGGWVRAADGVVCVTLLLATSFEQLTLIHARQDFSLPQIHRILHSGGSGGNGGSGSGSGSGGAAVVFVQSALGLCVVAPAAHPLVVPLAQRVVRVAVRCDPAIAQLSAAVAPADAPPPSAPSADRGLLLVQRSFSDAGAAEVLLDVHAARRKYGAGVPLFVHLFERNRRADADGAFAHIGFVRVTPVAGPYVSVLEEEVEDGDGVEKEWRRNKNKKSVRNFTEAVAAGSAVELRDEPGGWPLVTGEFDERCATLIAPLSGALVSHGAAHRVALRLPRSPPYLAHALAAAREKFSRNASEPGGLSSPVGSAEALAQRVAECRAGLLAAEKELAQDAAALEQDAAALRRQMARRRGKELAKLRRLEDDARRKLDAMRSRAETARAALAGAESDLVRRGREQALREARARELEAEIRRLEERADRSRPLRVEVMLVAEDRPLETTRLEPSDDAATLYDAEVHVARGFRGRAVLLINDLEAVWWEVRPGY